MTIDNEPVTAKTVLYKTILDKVVTLLQLPLIILFILFEEIIWEGIAEPIYTQVKSLHILAKLEAKLAIIPANLVLFLFVFIFSLVEVAGLVAGYYLVRGQVLLGVCIYLSKIPIAGFTFWMFKVCKEKLLSFAWFAWIYHKLIALFEKIKSMSLYQNLITNMQQIKTTVKTYFQSFKLEYFSGKSTFISRFKILYHHIKIFLKK